MAGRKREVAAGLLAGLLFGVGLALAGMTVPEKVIGFLDVFDGSWDPSLALVMAGAIGVHALVYQLVSGRPAPIWATKWSLPTRRDIDGRLLLGAALFGAGWGLGGFCPGPGVTSLVSGAASSVVFAVTMLITMAITSRLDAAMRASSSQPVPSAEPRPVPASSESTQP